MYCTIAVNGGLLLYMQGAELDVQNYDACINLLLPDVEPACVCGAKYEDVNHFFMSCLNYNDIRRNLKQSVDKFILESERFI